MRFIAEHKDRTEGGLRWGVESICAVLSGHGTAIAVSTYYDAAARTPSKRALRDEDLKVQINRVRAANYDVYGPRKVWLQLNREGIPVARCTVERLMGELQLRGARRGNGSSRQGQTRRQLGRRIWCSAGSAHQHRTGFGSRTTSQRGRGWSSR